MKVMGSHLKESGDKKPKLPRKRKKKAIKAQGRKWYHDNIKLYKILFDNPEDELKEPICKFWVNSQLKNEPRIMKSGGVYMTPVPTKYW